MHTPEATGTPLLEQPQARDLLAEAKVTGRQVEGCARRLDRFLKRYWPLFYRKEQAHNARIAIQGLLSGLARKTAEPIARAHGVHRLRPPPSPGRIAREITAVLTRNQQSRIYHWHARTGQFPPRLNPGGSG